jgi:hypothetical protein
VCQRLWRCWWWSYQRVVIVDAQLREAAVGGRRVVRAGVGEFGQGADIEGGALSGVA